MTLPPPPAPPGWYPDPTRRHECRYWSGTVWTRDVADRGIPGVEELPRRTLAEPNTAPDWISRGLWRRWPAPQNAVRGESYHQNAFFNLVGSLNEESQHYDPVDVELVRDPANLYDPFACEARVDGHLCGYLAREIAREVAPLADGAGVTRWIVAGVIVGGCVDAPTFGLHLWLDRRLSPGPEWPDLVGQQATQPTRQ